MHREAVYTVEARGELNLLEVSWREENTNTNMCIYKTLNAYTNRFDTEYIHEHR